MESQKESELKQFLTEIADAIREVRETKELINAQDMREEILELGTSGLPLPVEVSTEEEMTALLESGKVGGIYKYTGTTGTYENGALYELTEEESDPLQGTWVFNDTLTFSKVDFNINIQFVSNDNNYSKFYIIGSNYYIVYSYGSLSTPADDAFKHGWIEEAYKTIYISSLYNELTATIGTVEDFFSWLQANATKQVSKQFTKLILQTDLEEITINENGEYSGEYSNITVEVPRPQLFAPVISLEGSILTISDDNNGDFVNTYRVLVDGVEKVSYNYTFSEIDLSTLELEDGTYTITIVATGINFVDSVASNGVSYVKNTPFLIFSSPEAFTLNIVDNIKYWDGTLEYSTDTQSWSEWDGTTTLSSSEDGNLYMRGTGNTIITGYTAGTASTTMARWVLTGNNISCNGNIENLLDYQTVMNGENPTMGDYCYYFMFANCTSLTTAPKLPATTLTRGCYGNMFRGTGINTAPELPATTLSSNCYIGMFNSCTGLTTAPALPATTLSSNCYTHMFFECINLTTLPKLPATDLSYGCYSSMFQGCSNIKLSTMQTDEYQNVYRIPTIGEGKVSNKSLFAMFSNTGGTFSGIPTINTTYYTSNKVV